MLILRPMRPDEFPGYLADQIEASAQENAESYLAELDQARKDARRELTEQLTDGVETEGHFIYVVEQEGDAGRVPVGRIWFSIEEPGGFAWLDSIEIDDAYQSQGLGGQLLALVQEELTRQGILSMSLHVAATNERAYRFYQRNGYHTTAYNMDHRWPLDADRPAPTIHLRPVTAAEMEAVLQHESQKLAQAYAAVYGQDPDQAFQMASGQVRGRLPEGLQTDHHRLYMIQTNSETSDALGHIWFSRSQDEPVAWLNSFALYALTLDRELAAQVFSVVEDELSRDGIATMKLYLVGNDEDAHQLYQHVGFRIAGRHMAKRW